MHTAESAVLIDSNLLSLRLRLPTTLSGTATICIFSLRCILYNHSTPQKEKPGPAEVWISMICVLLYWFPWLNNEWVYMSHYFPLMFNSSVIKSERSDWLITDANNVEVYLNEGLRAKVHGITLMRYNHKVSVLQETALYGKIPPKRSALASFSASWKQPDHLRVLQAKCRREEDVKNISAANANLDFCSATVPSYHHTMTCFYLFLMIIKTWTQVVNVFLTSPHCTCLTTLLHPDTISAAAHREKSHFVCICIFSSLYFAHLGKNAPLCTFIKTKVQNLQCA